MSQIRNHAHRLSETVGGNTLQTKSLLGEYCDQRSACSTIPSLISVTWFN